MNQEDIVGLVVSASLFWLYLGVAVNLAKATSEKNLRQKVFLCFLLGPIAWAIMVVLLPPTFLTLYVYKKLGD